MSSILVDNIHAKNPRLIVNSTKGNSWKLLFFFLLKLPGLGRPPGGGHGDSSSILAWRIPMDRGVTKSPTQLSD